MGTNKFTCDCTIIHQNIIDKVKANMLEEDCFEKATYFFKIIGDKTRMKILWALSQNEMCVCDISNLLSMSKSAVSHQLSVLRKAKLVKFRKEGKSAYYSLADNHVKTMIESGISHVED